MEPGETLQQAACREAYEARSVLGFRWWCADELSQTRETVFPPALGHLLTALLQDGPPPEPVEITDLAAP